MGEELMRHSSTPTAGLSSADVSALGHWGRQCYYVMSSRKDDRMVMPICSGIPISNTLGAFAGKTLPFTGTLVLSAPFLNRSHPDSARIRVLLNCSNFERSATRVASQNKVNVKCK